MTKLAVSVVACLEPLRSVPFSPYDCNCSDTQTSNCIEGLMIKSPKQTAKMQSARFALFLGIVTTLALAVGLSRPKTAEDDILPKLGLKSGELITIDQMGKGEMAITMNGQDYIIDYAVLSNRSKNFKLKVQSANGELVEQNAPPANTIRGTLRGVVGSRVVGCVTEDGCCARIRFPAGEDCYLEPVSRSLDSPAFAGVHVVYSDDDVIASAGQCGTVTNLVDAKQQFERNLASAASAATVTSLQVCELALDADFEYFSTFGSTTATLAQLELIINIVNEQYESEADIRHAISDVTVWTSSNDPFTSSDPEALLTELRSFYRNRPRVGDLRHLFTGRDLDGNTVGIAYNSVVCNQFFGFGLSQHITPLADMTDLVAHELGHNWSLPHCSCANHTMNPSLTGANDFNDTLSVPTLIAYRNTRNCLDTIGPVGNDDLINGIPIADPNFSVTGTNFNGTTENGEQDLVNVGSSVWWSVSFESDGSATIDTFGSDFDTELHVYEFALDGELADLILVDQNDDTGGSQSQVTFDVTAGTRYEIRVGGFRPADSIGAGSEGNIVLNGTFTEAILGDFDADGDVDGNDVDFYIGNLDQPATGDLAQLDLNGDGQITLADHNLHVTTLVVTSNGVTGALLGDINLDGTVSVLLDAFGLIANLGQNVTSRSQGDLNADGLVEVLHDAFPLISQIGQSN